MTHRTQSTHSTATTGKAARSKFVKIDLREQDQALAVVEAFVGDLVVALEAVAADLVVVVLEASVAVVALSRVATAVVDTREAVAMVSKVVPTLKAEATTLLHQPKLPWRPTPSPTVSLLEARLTQSSTSRT